MPPPQAMLAFITRRDHLLMRRVHHWSAPRWVRLWMIAATRSGDGWLWYALAVAVWLFGGSQASRAIWAATIAASVGVAGFLVLKRATGRRRPCHLERHCWSTLLPPDQFSFPSGHTITAFAITIPLGLYYPNLSVGLGFIALSIAASRILLGMHFLSDVVAGAILGAALGFGSFALLG